MKIDAIALQKLVWIIYKRFFMEKGRLKDVQIKIGEYVHVLLVLDHKGIETRITLQGDLYIDHDLVLDTKGTIRYGFLKLNYEKLLKDWTKDIPEIQVQGKQIRIKNEYLKDIHLQNNEIELELL